MTAGSLELSRRRLLAAAGGGVLGLAGLPLAAEALAQAGAAAQRLAPIDPGLAPDSPAVRATMTAFADTIVPGPAGGADDEPGAVEAGALEAIYDPFYGASATFPVLHQDLALATPRVLRRPARFTLALPYPDRERVLDTRITPTARGGESPYPLLYAAAGILVYLAYYGSAVTEKGLDFIGLPPHSDGYYPGHSYDVRFRSMTRTSNPR